MEILFSSKKGIIFAKNGSALSRRICHTFSVKRVVSVGGSPILRIRSKNSVHFALSSVAFDVLGISTMTSAVFINKELP